MAVSHRLFSDALRDIQNAMAVFDQPFFSSPLLNEGFASNFGKLTRQSDSFVYSPATDVVEKPDAYELYAEIPGYEKKDIKIEVNDGRTLVLTGSKQKQTDQKAESEKKQETNGSQEQQVIREPEEKDTQAAANPKWWINERIGGSFSRSFTFPDQIDIEQVKASYENGVLKVIIPKVANRQSRLVDID
ncbi:HSP20-like chaperone [Choanephora cucurbitarum]|nr:HSP20-like chaperone [Choanephora cucurbitarum]